jgi:hypothetical protein
VGGGHRRAGNLRAATVADDADDDCVVGLLRMERSGSREYQDYCEHFPKHVGSFVVFGSPCFEASMYKEKGPEA